MINTAYSLLERLNSAHETITENTKNMCRRLNVAKIYKVELEYGGLFSDEIDAFMRLLDLFDIEIASRSNDDRELEIERAGLERLRRILYGKYRAYAANAEEIEEVLSSGNLTRERMVAALDILITGSDPSDSLVHIFCD